MFIIFMLFASDQRDSLKKGSDRFRNNNFLELSEGFTVYSVYAYLGHSRRIFRSHIAINPGSFPFRSFRK